MDDRHLPELLRRFGDMRAAEVFSALPCTVKSYDSATQCADLEVMVRAPIVREDGEVDVAHESLPVLPNVRVCFPSAGAYGITFPIVAGDEGWFIVSTLQTSEYRRTSKASDAVDVRRNDLGCGGMFMPCRITDAALLDHAATAALVLEGDEVRIGKDATEPIVRDDLAIDRIGELANAILTATPVPNDGGAGLQAAALVLLTSAGWTGTTPPSMGATKGKVE